LQLALNDGHASCWASSFQPGRSVKAVGRSCIAAGTAGGRGGGGVMHAATSIVTVAIAKWRRHGEMEWILLEAGVALFLAVFIVWFTTGGKRKRPPAAARPALDGKPNPDRDR
jgi:hypothetical protein